jgi:hypothetical protein
LAELELDVPAHPPCRGERGDPAELGDRVDEVGEVMAEERQQATAAGAAVVLEPGCAELIVDVAVDPPDDPVLAGEAWPAEEQERQPDHGEKGDGLGHLDPTSCFAPFLEWVDGQPDKGGSSGSLDMCFFAQPVVNVL